MRLSFRSGIPGLSFSRGRWLQLIACAVLAWAWLLGDLQVGRERPLAQPLIPASAPASLQPIAVAAAQAATITQATSAEEMPDPLAQSAALGLSTIQVVVSHNDTLDQIFRRLQLNL